MADIVALDQPCMSRGKLEQLDEEGAGCSSSVASRGWGNRRQGSQRAKGCRVK